MTLGDLSTLVAGVALGYAEIASHPLIAIFFVVPSPSVMLAFWILGLFHALTIAFAVVALGRVAAYRRMPRAAEWLAILVSAGVLADRPEFLVDAWVNRLLAMFPGGANPTNFDGWRWCLAGIGSLGIAAMFGVLRLGRRSFPRWLTTLILAGMATVALAGPLGVFDFLGANLVSPGPGFGPGPLGNLHRHACVLFGHFPTAVFFGLPAMAALLERSARLRWAWSEWGAMIASLLAGVWGLVLDREEFGGSWSLPNWPVVRAFDLAWLIVVALTSRWILIRFGPAWSRWIEPPVDPDRAASSDAISKSVDRQDEIGGSGE